MDTKIQLKHPAGKHAVRIDRDKYDLLSNVILHCLQSKPLTHKELLDAVTLSFKQQNRKFAGSVEWYMESVKLDMEANHLIERIKEKSALKFRITQNK